MQSTKQSGIIRGKIPFDPNIIKKEYIFMKKNICTFIAITLVTIQALTIISTNSIPATSAISISVYSDDLTSKDNKK